jgi:hypothetical protein
MKVLFFIKGIMLHKEQHTQNYNLTHCFVVRYQTSPIALKKERILSPKEHF